MARSAKKKKTGKKFDFLKPMPDNVCLCIYYATYIVHGYGFKKLSMYIELPFQFLRKKTLRNIQVLTAVYTGFAVNSTYSIAFICGQLLYS